jgi:hypothetical protein
VYVYEEIALARACVLFCVLTAFVCAIMCRAAPRAGVSANVFASVKFTWANCNGTERNKHKHSRDVFDSIQSTHILSLPLKNVIKKKHQNFPWA